MSYGEFTSIYTHNREFSFFENERGEPRAVLKGKEYYFPADPYDIERFKVIEARLKAALSGSFIEALSHPNVGGRRYFFDGDYGVICVRQVSPFLDGQTIYMDGAIFNPQKGEYVIDELTRILHQIAAESKKNVQYTTYLMNKTDHLRQLLIRKGFEQVEEGKELKYVVLKPDLAT